MDNAGNGFLFHEKEMIALEQGGDGRYEVDKNGVNGIWTTGDRKVDFIGYEDDQVFGYVKSKMGYPAIYPLLPARIEKPVKAVLMDLDGTNLEEVYGCSACGTIENAAEMLE